MPGFDWLIQIPLNELVALQSLPAQLEDLRKENMQLRREMEGLHRTLYETIAVISDLRKQLHALK